MNRLPCAAATLCLAAFAVAPRAQTQTPPAPHILIETVGPDGWRTRFGPTNLGSLLESERGRGLWQPQLLPLLGVWQQIAGDATTFDAMRNRWLGYGGRVRVGVWMHDGTHGHRGVARTVMVLDGDGRTDLRAVAADVRQLQKQLDGEWSTQELGGEKVEVLQQDEDRMTAPTAVGGQYVVAMTSQDDLAAAFADARAWTAGATGKPPAPTTPALRLEVDVAALVALANAKDDAEGRAITQVLGLGSLGRAQMTWSTAGPCVQVELAQDFAPAPQGLFAAFFPPRQGVPALRRAVPKGDGTWRAGHFDFQALFDTALAAAKVMNLPDTRDVRKEMKDELGIDLGDDLVAHMTSEVLVLGAPLAALDRPGDFTWTVAVHLRDATAFARGLDTLLAKSKPNLSREETTSHGGVECKRYGNMFGYDLWFAVGHDTFFFAGGRDAEDHLAAAIAGVKAAAGADAPPGPDDAFADLGRFLPPGLASQARGDLEPLFALPTEWLALLLGEVLPFRIAERQETAPEERERLLALLQQHHLATVRTAAGYAAGTWRWRLFW